MEKKIYPSYHDEGGVIAEADKEKDCILPGLPNARSDFLRHPDGYRMHFVEAGDIDNPVIVLVHGFPENWTIWQHMIPIFVANRWRVLAVDLRGCGKTFIEGRENELSDFTTKIACADIATLLTRKGIKKAVWCGRGVGATVAWSARLHCPQFVESLIMLSVSPLFVSSPPMADEHSPPDLNDIYPLGYYIHSFVGDSFEKFAERNFEDAFYFAVGGDPSLLFSEQKPPPHGMSEAYYKKLTNSFKARGLPVGWFQSYKLDWEDNRIANAGREKIAGKRSKNFDSLEGLLVLGENDSVVGGTSKSLKVVPAPGDHICKVEEQTAKGVGHWLFSRDDSKSYSDIILPWLSERVRPWSD